MSRSAERSACRAAKSAGIPTDRQDVAHPEGSAFHWQTLPAQDPPGTDSSRYSVLRAAQSTVQQAHGSLPVEYAVETMRTCPLEKAVPDPPDPIRPQLSRLRPEPPIRSRQIPGVAAAGSERNPYPPPLVKHDGRPDSGGVRTDGPSGWGLLSLCLACMSTQAGSADAIAGQSLAPQQAQQTQWPKTMPDARLPPQFATVLTTLIHRAAYPSGRTSPAIPGVPSPFADIRPPDQPFTFPKIP